MGCSNDCLSVAQNYTCSGGNSTKPDVCFLNYTVDPLPLECFDNNFLNGDGCSSIFKIEQGYTCYGVISTCTSFCGNSKRSSAEQCDDGNNIANDGCTNCVQDYGFKCSGSEPDICTSSCGDGMKASTEDCDDGNLVSLDGCFNCEIESNSSCDTTLNPSQCDVCGNSLRRHPELCDDGIKADGEGCASDCLSVLSTWICSGGSNTAKDVCVPKYGDGFIVGIE